MRWVEVWGGTRQATTTGVGWGAVGLPRPVEAWGGESSGCHGRHGEWSRRDRRGEGSRTRRGEAAVNPSFSYVSCRGEKRRKEVSVRKMNEGRSEPASP
jgi:hypothetical protein